MPDLTAGQFFCLAIVALLVIGAGVTAWAKAFAARKTGQWPSDD
jgi:hypothetical protein